MQWRKVFDHNPLFIVFSDKLASKDYIARLCPDLHIPKTLWQGDSIDAAPSSILAGDAVVKANHGSSMNYFIRSGDYDRSELKYVTRKWMAQIYGRSNAEWAYKHVRRCILIEERLFGEAGPLVEINIRAGRGKAWLGSLLINAKTERQSAIYLDRDAQRCGVLLGRGVDPAELDGVYAPGAYQDAIRYAELLSIDIDYARFDFFWTGSRLYAGEITPYPASGYSAGQPVADLLWRKWDIRSSWFMHTSFNGWRSRYQTLLLEHLDRIRPKA